MTEQEKQEIIDEVEKRLEEKKYIRHTDGTRTVFQGIRDKWFRDESGTTYYSLMTGAFNEPGISWQVYELIRRLTCLIHGKQYVRHVVGDDKASDTAEKICQFIYDLRMEVKK